MQKLATHLFGLTTGALRYSDEGLLEEEEVRDHIGERRDERRVDQLHVIGYVK